MFHRITNLKKSPTISSSILERMMNHIKTKTSFMTNSKKIKDLIITYHLGCKNICISCPIVRTDNRKANNVLKRYLYTKNKKEMLFFIITFLMLILVDMVFILRVTGLLCYQEILYQGLVWNNITLASNVEPLTDSDVINLDNYSNKSVGSVLKK